jgi:hypothetical protein
LPGLRGANPGSFDFHLFSHHFSAEPQRLLPGLIFLLTHRFRQFANGSQMDRTEIETYKVFLPEMEQFEADQTGSSGNR